MHNLALAQLTNWIESEEGTTTAKSNPEKHAMGEYFDPHNYVLAQQRLYAMKDRIERYQAIEAEKNTKETLEKARRTYTHF